MAAASPKRKRVCSRKSKTWISTAAENDLYDMLEEGLTPVKLKLALWFYTQLRALSDETLEKADFSREEIDEGLEGVLKMYNITE